MEGFVLSNASFTFLFLSDRIFFLQGGVRKCYKRKSRIVVSPP